MLGPCTGAVWFTRRFVMLNVNPILSMPSRLAGLSASAAGLLQERRPGERHADAPAVVRGGLGVGACERGSQQAGEKACRQ